MIIIILSTSFRLHFSTCSDRAACSPGERNEQDAPGRLHLIGACRTRQATAMQDLRGSELRLSWNITISPPRGYLARQQAPNSGEEGCTHTFRESVSIPQAHLLTQFLQVYSVPPGKLHARRLCGVHVSPYRFERHSMCLARPKCGRQGTAAHSMFSAGS